MKFDIEKFRQIYSSIRNSEVVVDLPPGPVEYRLEARSSFKVVDPYVSRLRKQVSEQFLVLSNELKEVADSQGGHQSLYVYARKLGESASELISSYKYSPDQGAWVHLVGVDLIAEPSNDRVISERLREFESTKVDPIDDPEMDDDPTPVGQRKRNPWREAEEVKKASKSDSKDDEDPADDGTVRKDLKQKDREGRAVTKSPPSSAGAQTMGPKSPSGGIAPPPRSKSKKGVMGMDKDKDGFAKHGQRQTLPQTVMGASQQRMALWRSHYLA